MKRRYILIALVLGACFFGLSIMTNQISAYKPGYEIDNYVAIEIPTIDGNWTTADEWTDAEEAQLDGGLTVYFRLKYAQEDSTFFQYILIDFLNDTTDDPSDGFSLCFDAHHDGGTAPQTDDYMISLQGHGISGLHVYQGNGVDWTEIFDYSLGKDLVIVNNINPSPASSTPHWIAEFKVNSTWLSLLNDYWLRVAAFDDSSGAGNNVWPSSYAGTPDDWGLTVTKFTQIPEFNVVFILTFLIALVPIIYYVKRHQSNVRGSLL